MDIFSPQVGILLSDVLTALRRDLFPGMSSDEADAFYLGYWAGAWALAIGAVEEAPTADQVAERIELELKRIGEGRDPA